MTNTKKILIVDDDRDIRSLLADHRFWLLALVVALVAEDSSRALVQTDFGSA